MMEEDGKQLLGRERINLESQVVSNPPSGQQRGVRIAEVMPMVLEHKLLVVRSPLLRVKY